MHRWCDDGSRVDAFVGCQNVDGDMIGPPAPHDLALETAVDLGAKPDASWPDAGLGDLDIGGGGDADSSPGDLGE